VTENHSTPDRLPWKAATFTNQLAMLQRSVLIDPVLRLLLALFALTIVTWLLAAFVPVFQGWHHLANLGFRSLVYGFAIVSLLQGFRLFNRRG
jgi:hypothetical protein